LSKFSRKQIRLDAPLVVGKKPRKLRSVTSLLYRLTPQDLAEGASQIEVIYLPSHSPELNPEERRRD
jgi:hypothetical protein